LKGGLNEARLERVLAIPCVVFVSMCASMRVVFVLMRASICVVLILMRAMHPDLLALSVRTLELSNGQRL